MSQWTLYVDPHGEKLSIRQVPKGTLAELHSSELANKQKRIPQRPTRI